MYGLAVMLFIPRQTTSKNIDEMFSKTWNVFKKNSEFNWNSICVKINSKIDTQCILVVRGPVLYTVGQ